VSSASDDAPKLHYTDLAYAGLELDARNVRRFRFRPEGLHQIARFLVPGQFWVVAAGTGIGKTTFLLSVADDFLIQGAKVAYLGLEMEPDELATAFACLRAQVPRWVAVENAWGEVPNGEDKFHRVREHIFAQAVRPLADQLKFLPHRYITPAILHEAAAEAHDWGADILIVDHINHVETEGYNDFAKLVKLSKRIAEEYSLVNISAAQINRDAVRGGHRLTRWQPMQLHHIQGGGVIEQNAVVVLNPYRPLVTGTDETTKRLIKMAMKGDIEDTSVLQKDRMGVAVLKHRPRGDLVGQRTVLRFEHGKLLDL
jgi:replicative DNA helicase